MLQGLLTKREQASHTLAEYAPGKQDVINHLRVVFSFASEGLDLANKTTYNKVSIYVEDFL
ncbi:MAG: hypothetical protein RLZZ410_326 [Pseudomonadota bacterium]|jgi:hypothetical protein